MRPIAATVAGALCCLLAAAASGRADAIQKWRTPSGTLYFGDRPPAGSVLLETFPDVPRAESAANPGEDPALLRAAADGREIIRRREAERAAVERASAVATLEETTPLHEPGFLIATSGCGDRCAFHRHRHRRPRADFVAHRPGAGGGRPAALAQSPPREPSGGASPRSVRTSSSARFFQ